MSPAAIWTAGHWSTFLAIAEHLGDRDAVDTLTEHAPLANHCRGYAVAAWPCPVAADVLEHLKEVCP